RALLRALNRGLPPQLPSRYSPPRALPPFGQIKKISALGLGGHPPRRNCSTPLSLPASESASIISIPAPDSSSQSRCRKADLAVPTFARRRASRRSDRVRE